jgi:hypothetical protein
MIDLFSILFSTGMLMLIIFRAIKLNAAGDSYPHGRNDFRALNGHQAAHDGDRIR